MRQGIALLLSFSRSFSASKGNVIPFFTNCCPAKRGNNALLKKLCQDFAFTPQASLPPLRVRLGAQRGKNPPFEGGDLRSGESSEASAASRLGRSGDPSSDSRQIEHLFMAFNGDFDLPPRPETIQHFPGVRLFDTERGECHQISGHFQGFRLGGVMLFPGIRPNLFLFPCAGFRINPQRAHSSRNRAVLSFHNNRPLPDFSFGSMRSAPNRSNLFPSGVWSGRLWALIRTSTYPPFRTTYEIPLRFP